VLERRHRLTTSAGFTTATRSGRRAGSRTLVVHLAESPEVGELRAGFVVSRAVGNAVTRNRVKRRLRALVRERLAALPPALLVVRSLPAASNASTATLARDLDAALGRLGITGPDAGPEVGRDAAAGLAPSSPTAGAPR
jgi:ribonuclease P protein component